MTKLLVNGNWVDYTGRTSTRKLYVRAYCAERRSGKSFYVHEYGRVQGIQLDPAFKIPYATMNGVLNVDLPRRIVLVPEPSRQLKKIRVYDGSLIDPYNVKPEDIKPYVFIHALSCINRYTGHAKYPYSVAQHSTNLALSVPEHLKRVAILHDFSEGLFNDRASPVKSENPLYKEAEHECGIRIFNHFGISSDEYMELDEWDKRIYANERNVLFEGKIVERGRGDELLPLPMGKLTNKVFEYQDWRVAKRNLTSLWMMFFKDYDLITGDYIGF